MRAYTHSFTTASCTKILRVPQLRAPINGPFSQVGIVHQVQVAFLALPRSLAPSLPRSLAPSLPRSLAPSLPRSLALSLSRSLALSLPLTNLKSANWTNAQSIIVLDIIYFAVTC